MFFKDVKMVIGLDCKLMFKNRAVIVIFSVISILLLFMLKSFSAEINEKSSIPIGIADEDQTELSKKFVENCKQQEGIYVYALSEDDLKQKLYKNEITGYFVVKAGFSQNVSKGRGKHLIEMYSYKDTGFAGLVSDILAGEIMYDLCLSRTWNLYEKLDSAQSQYNREQFSDYMEQMKKDSRYQYAFDIHMVNEKEENVKQTAFRYQLIYEQVLFGIIAVMFSLIAMFLVWSILEQSLLDVVMRRQMLAISNSAFVFGDLLAAGGVLWIYSALYSGMMCLMANNISVKSLIMLFFIDAAFAISIVSLFWVVMKCLKNDTAYQLAGFFLIFLMGIVSLLGIFSSNMGKVVEILPNTWFIKGITHILC